MCTQYLNEQEKAALREAESNIEQIEGEVNSKVEQELKPVQAALQTCAEYMQPFLEDEVGRIERDILEPLRADMASSQRAVDEIMALSLRRQQEAEFNRQEEESRQEAIRQANEVAALWSQFMLEVDAERKHDLSTQILEKLNSNHRCAEFVAWDRVDQVGMAIFLLGTQTYEEVLNNAEALTDKLRVTRCLSYNGLIANQRLSADSRRKLEFCRNYDNLLRRRQDEQTQEALDELIGDLFG